MKISKSMLGFLGKLLFSILKSVATEQAFIAFLLYLEEEAKKTKTPLDDFAVKIGWIIRDKIWQRTEEQMKAKLIKDILDGRLKSE